MDSVIKFRGLTTDFGKDGFVYGNYAIMNGDKSFIIPIGLSYGSLGYYRVTKKSVGQYSGRKCANGNDLYDGDIIKFHHDEDDYVGLIRVTLYDGVTVKTKRGYTLPFCKCHAVEAIGNIHQNPELLK